MSDTESIPTSEPIPPLYPSILEYLNFDDKSLPDHIQAKNKFALNYASLISIGAMEAIVLIKRISEKDMYSNMLIDEDSETYKSTYSLIYRDIDFMDSTLFSDLPIAPQTNLFAVGQNLNGKIWEKSVHYPYFLRRGVLHIFDIDQSVAENDCRVWYPMALLNHPVQIDFVIEGVEVNVNIGSASLFLGGEENNDLISEYGDKNCRAELCAFDAIMLDKLHELANYCFVTLRLDMSATSSVNWDFVDEYDKLPTRVLVMVVSAYVRMDERIKLLKMIMDKLDTSDELLHIYETCGKFIRRELRLCIDSFKWLKAIMSRFNVDIKDIYYLQTTDVGTYDERYVIAMNLLYLCACDTKRNDKVFS